MSVIMTDVVESKNTVQPGPPMKWCPGCYRSRDVKEFEGNSGRKDGLQCHCAICRKSVKDAWAKTEHGRIRAVL